ncbi:MAG: hypothetical protein EOP48_02390, partial [Sphingobacteriales bacterium]
YFNRMCFRSTPFGLFSAVSALVWGSDMQPITQKSRHRIIHYLSSYQRLLDVPNVVFSRKSFKIFPNNSLYVVGKEYRYLRSQFNHNQGKRSFSLNGVKKDRQLKTIIDYCRKSVTPSQFTNFLVNKFGVEKNEAKFHMISFLRDQLLTSPDIPKITGKDGTKQLTIQELQQRLVFNIGPHYINLEQANISGVLDSSLQNQILNGLHCLNRLSSFVQITPLDEFGKKFIERYGNRAVALLEALDPEVGIEYLSLTSSKNQPVLLKDINWPEIQHRTIRVGSEEVRQYLLQSWINGKGTL